MRKDTILVLMAFLNNSVDPFGIGADYKVYVNGAFLKIAIHLNFDAEDEIFFELFLQTAPFLFEKIR